MGRVNFGAQLTDFKGLGPVGVICDYYYVFDWISYPLPLTGVSKLPYLFFYCYYF